LDILFRCFLVENVAKTIFGGKKFFYIVPEKIVIGDAVWLLTWIDVDKCLNYQQSVTGGCGTPQVMTYSMNL
jgi:hypothetical protein